jgi:two-component system, OmpR family, sensor histidine kinase QseC
VSRAWPRSLQARLLLLVLGTVVAVWSASALMTWFDVRHELDELLDAHLAQAAALLVVRQVGEIEDDDHGVDAPSLHRYAPRVAFQVFHEGRLVLRSTNAPLSPLVAPDAGFRSGFRTVQIDATAWRLFAAQGARRDVQVFVGEQMESRADILRAVLRSTLWPIVLALPLLALAAAWAVRQGVAPLKRLGRALAAREPRALEPVVMTGMPSEMTPMLDALNQLFVRIGAMVESERRFTADAAHELRTPVAGIRAQAQVALSVADDGVRRRALTRTLEGCDRASHLIDQLLILSRLDADAQARPSSENVDMSELVRSVAAELAPMALRQGQTLELDAPAPCCSLGDATLLAVLVRNLIDNALRYSPEGARVHAAVRSERDKVIVSVEDGGPGLADDDRVRLGERFFRVPGSAATGSGLGWSIVRRIAEVHGAALHVDRSASLGGLAVRVCFGAQPPRASSASSA